MYFEIEQMLVSSGVRRCHTSRFLYGRGGVGMIRREPRKAQDSKSLESDQTRGAAALHDAPAYY